MKELFADRLVRAIFAATGLIATVGGPRPVSAPKLEAFASNGCSVFPDGNTFGCCYVHDMAYWKGGTAAERRKADRALEQCAADVTHNPVIGNPVIAHQKIGNHVVGGLMYVAVSLFGLPGVPTRVEWGYGWGETRQVGYHPLTPTELEQVDARKQDACRALTPDPAAKRYMIDTTHWIREGDVQQICAPSLVQPSTAKPRKPGSN